MAVAEREHTEVDAHEREAFRPLLVDWRRQFGFQILKLVEEVVNFLVQHVLLLGPTRVLQPICLLLRHAGKVLKELVDLGHLEVVVPYCPHKPIKVLLQLEVLASHHQTIERA